MAITTQQQLLAEILDNYLKSYAYPLELRDILLYMAENGAQSPCRVLSPDVTVTFESDAVSNPENPYTGAEINLSATGALPGKSILLIHSGTTPPAITPGVGITIDSTEGQYYATTPATPNAISIVHLDGGKVRVQYLTQQGSFINLATLGGQPKTLTVTTKTAAYTLASIDAGTLLNFNTAGAVALTVPPNADVFLPIGYQVMVTQQGAGALTITPGSGVTLHSAGGKNILNVQYSSCSLVKKDTNVWQLQGDLKA